MRKHKSLYNQGYILIFLFILYFLQGILYPEGTIISQSIVFLWILIGLVYMGKAAIYRHKPAVVKWLLLFYVIQVFTFIFSPKTVNGVLYEAIGVVPTMNQLKDISVFVLSFMVMYVFSRKSGGFSEKSIRYICYALLLLAIVRYFYLQGLLQMILQQEDVTNSSAYFLVALLPYFPYILKRSKLLCIVLLIVVITLVMIASKRGAIVTMIVALAFSIFYYMRNSKFSTRNVLVILTVLVALVGGIYYAYLSNDWLLSRIADMENVGMGGRGVAYPVLFNHWYNDMNFWSLMFGNGMSQTVEVWGNYAHNDWLELLINNGILGVVVYLMIFITAFRTIYRSTLSTESRLAAYLCLVVLLSQTIFSMGYASISNSIYTMLLGIIIGSIKYKDTPQKRYVYGYKTNTMLD